ncbi:MAG: hypothetical protein ACOCUA_00215, partial [archaeon]
MISLNAKVVAIALAAVLVTGGAAMAASIADTAEGDLAVNVTQDEDLNVTVAVTHNETAAEGANVTVEAVPPGRTYNASGNYTADANGTVTLPPPEGGDLLVEITASYANETATLEAVLEGTGGEENESEANENKSFGQELQTFIAGLDNDTHPRGLAIASWVTA